MLVADTKASVFVLESKRLDACLIKKFWGKFHRRLWLLEELLFSLLEVVETIHVVATL